MTNSSRAPHLTALTFALLATLFTALATRVGAAPPLEELKSELETNEAALAKPLADLGARYQEELKKLWEATGREGQLETVLAAEKELKRFQNDDRLETVTEPKVKRLLDIYLKAKADLEKQHLQERGKLYSAYLAQLKALEIDLTRNGFVEKAVKVKEEREAATAIFADLRDAALLESGAKLRGRFHFFVDDDAWLYLNGEMISQRHRKKAGVATSGVVEVKAGDRVFAHVQNMGGAFRFRLAFLAENGRDTIQFRSADFTDLFDVVKKSPDFTNEHLRHPDAHGAVRLTKYPNNPFDFANGSDWVWGKRGFSCLAATISPAMIRTTAER